jgi:RHS repeat-associated protein
VQDAATGLTYMQQRYYDPLIGRFLSVDPVTALDDPVGYFNRYVYASNNPYRFRDPDGRSWEGTVEFLSGIGRAVLDAFPGGGGPSVYGTMDMSEFRANATPIGPPEGFIGRRSYQATSDAISGISARSLGRALGRATSNVVVTKPAPSPNPELIQTNPKNLIPTQGRNEISGSQVKRMAKDMKENGYNQAHPVDAVKNESGRLEIQDGHHRVEAAKKAGLEKIPVNVWREE